MNKIRIAIAGAGNCASSLVQGIEFYKKSTKSASLSGLMHYDLGGYLPGDITVVAAFDIDKRKVGKPLHEAIFAKPNCTKSFQKMSRRSGVTVSMGNILDGVASHMEQYPDDHRFIPADRKPVDVAKVLKTTGTEILLNYLPVGSEKATAFYAEACLKAGV
ncbi:MAG: inositol-3-phosphate synthase, partial [Nitrospirota bacterium]|nr:inositol-3-phosphate synthase [Nitrospirota bacterium]